MHLYPFTKQTLNSIAITLGVFLLFYFWEFPVNQMHSKGLKSVFVLFAIGLKSILVALVYVFINYKFIISPEINQTLDKLLLKIRIKK